MDKSRIEEFLCCEESQAKLVASGQYLFHLGDECNHYVFVRNGVVRVELLSSTGQQLLLYRIKDGQSCVMTTACLLGTSCYFAQAVTETQVDLVLLPQSVFRLRLAESPEFREFVFHSFSERLASLMQRTAELATYTVDQRLAAVLLAHVKLRVSGGQVTLTHEQLAVEIGSAREVVSRRLAVFEKQGLIVRHRGYIEVTDIEKLTQTVAD